MRFGDVRGNEGVIEALVGMVDSGRIPHAIMFHEDDGGGGVSICLAFLQYLMCRSRDGGDSCGVCPSCNKISKLIHPDVHFVFPVTGGSIIPSSAKPTSLSYAAQWRELVTTNPAFGERDLNEALGIEGKSALISVADAKEILEQLSFNSLEGGYRAVVVYLPEKMNAEAANRLLKSIEEPPEKTEFLLVAHAPEKVLQTISSRCQCIRIVPADSHSAAGQAYSADEFEYVMSLLNAVSVKDFFQALEIAESIAGLPSRENVKSFLKVLAVTLRGVFFFQQGLPEMGGVPSGQTEPVGSIAAKLKKTFPRMALPLIDEAQKLVDRNVSIKIVLCDLVNRMFSI